MFRTLLISMFLTSAALADTWTVDDDGKADFDNIQAAVDAASDGDEIIVMPGTYTSTADEVVNMLGKAVWLHSSGGQEVTFIDGDSTRRGILCDSGETSKTIIEGFTITNCARDGGGGMYCNGSSPTVINCSFYNNSSTSNGAGMSCRSNSNPIITSCSFISNSNNQENYPGGGVVSISSNPLITDTYFCDNWPTHMLGDWTDGGGTCFSFSCNDSDGDGRPDECDTVGDGVHHVPEEYKTIQEAIYAAGDHDEIIVGPGTYTCEDTGSIYDSVFNPGGKRLWIHSSDGPELTVIDSCDSSYGLFVNNGETPETLIEGFTFSLSGQFNTFNVYCFYSSPTIRDCIISGGTYFGMSCSWSSAVVSNCIFVNNRTGMQLQGSGTPTISNCRFEENNNSNQGGGIYIYEDSFGQSFLPVISNCTFINNSAGTGYGGGLYAYGESSDGSRLTLTDCTFENNTAAVRGGGTYIRGWDMTMTNCSFTNNTGGGGGGGIYFINTTNGYSFMDNCIVKNNTGVFGGGMGTFIWGGLDQFIVSDTIFCGNTPNNYYNEAGGDSFTDGGGNTDAYVCFEDCPDINSDGDVNVNDVLTLITYWGSDWAGADVNYDGIVDVSDLLIVISNWGPCE